MTSRLLDSLGTTDALAELFGDQSVLGRMLDVEVALARAEAAAGVIPDAAARTIASAAQAEEFDVRAIAGAAIASATPVIAFVDALVDRVRRVDEESARYVHWGATSQDVADSALALLIARARAILAPDHARVTRALRRLSDEHAATVMIGRTLLQPATPTTFGLKAAAWYAAAESSWRRLHHAFDEGATLQFGGASGTLAALGTKGPEVADALARELGLSPSTPWHTDRVRLCTLVAACGTYTGALGKIARDVSLLMQAEVGELAADGGGSSTMPQKNNPAGCVVALAAAARLPGLVATMMSAMVQEHERAVGGSQAEWPVTAEAIQATGAAVFALAGTFETLRVVPERMRANLEATRGTIYSEPIALRLRAALGREAAERIVAEALERSREGATTMLDALVSLPEVTRVVPRGDLETMMRPEAYLGAAEPFRRALLGMAPVRVPA